MLMFIVANLVGSTIQITTLPLPVLSTLQASGLVFNSICASIILHEPFTRYSLIGTILVAAGALLIALFGAIAEPSHNLDQLLVLLGRQHFLVWMSATGFIVALLLVATWLLKRMYPRTTPRLRLIRGMCYGCISGILSAHSLLIAKSAVELLVRTIVDRHNQFDRWQSWMILIGLVVFALTQLYYMHLGLKLCSTSVLYPLVFCIYNIIAILDGLIYFHQSDRLSNLHAGLIALGTVVLLAGVVCLSWRLEDVEEESSSPAASKHMGRVPMPQTALQPGIGLVPSHVLDESDSEVDIDEEMPGLRGSTREQAQPQPLNERTPLLPRASTGPAHVPGTRPKKRLTIDTSQEHSPRASPSPLRTSRRRRMTLSEETNEIWNELNDRDAQPSPARRSTDLADPPRSATTLGRRKTPQSAWLNQMRRRSWFDSISSGHRRGRSISQGKRPMNSSPSLLTHPDPEDYDDNHDTSDADEADTSQRKRPWGFGGSERSEDGVGDWFKLKWWRKRWRDGNGDDERVP